MKLASAIISLLFPLLVSAQILPTNRTPNNAGNWVDLAGVPYGGIPATNRTIYASHVSGDSEASIQTDLNNCPAGQIVFLNAGTYTFASQLTIANSQVTLMGAGSNTIVNINNFNGILVGNTGWSTPWTTPVAARHSNITNGFWGTTITVTNVGDIAVGEIAFVDMLNDTNASAIGSQGTADPAAYTSVAYPNYGTDRQQNQCMFVTAVSGTNITFSMPLAMNNYGQGYTNGLVPQVWWFSPGATLYSGVENMTIVGNQQGQGIYFQNCYECWARNLNLTGFRYGISTKVAVQCEFRHNYIYGPETTTDDYDFQLFNTSGTLVEDNICNHQGTSIIQVGCVGCVFTYNYMTNITGQPGRMQGGLTTHGDNPNMNLYEGNVGVGFWLQDNWGSTEYNTAFRNRFSGQDSAWIINGTNGLNGDIQAALICATNRFTTMIGNVLGTTSYNTWYEDIGNTISPCHDGSANAGATGRVFFVGNPNGECFGGQDIWTATNLLRVCNWDSAHGSIDDLNGYPTSITISSNCPASALPASYVYTSKPSIFGALTWPPIDPSNPVYSSSITNIPSGYRFVFGVDPPSQFTNAVVSTGGGMWPPM